MKNLFLLSLMGLSIFGNANAARWSCSADSCMQRRHYDEFTNKGQVIGESNTKAKAFAEMYTKCVNKGIENHVYQLQKHIKGTNGYFNLPVHDRSRVNEGDMDQFCTLK